MNKKFVIFFTLIVLLLSTACNSMNKATSNDPALVNQKVKKEKKGKGKGPGKPDEWFILQRAFPEKKLSPDKFKKGLEQANQLKDLTAKKEADLLSMTWQLKGPSNIGGRIVDLVVDHKNKDTLYIAVATGGIWKSIDAGKTFQQAWSDDLPQAMGAITMTSDGILYAGTGEANPGGGSVVFGGGGIYRSIDQGKTWQNIGLSNSGAIGEIAVDPSNPKRIFVAATGYLFATGGERGLYLTTDGGQTWSLVLPGANPSTGAVDVAIDPKNPNVVYAVMWDRYRQPAERRYGGEGSGIFRSKDGGQTWDRLGQGLPTVSKDIGRIGIAVAPNNPAQLYAIVNKTNGTFEGFYSSNNQGDTWTKFSSSTLSNAQSSYGWWFGKLWVDPANEKHVFAAGVPLLESTDGGKRWIASSNNSFHVDQHALAWDPLTPSRVYLGNDGGVYRSDKNGSLRSSWIKSTYQPFNQFYTIDVSAQDSTRISGGTQDNGSLRTWGSTNWNEYYGGDGLANLINYQNHNIVYACYQYGECARSEDGGNRMISFTSQTVSERRAWLTPLIFDPNNPSIMYYAGNKLNKSTDGGRTWAVISPDLTGGPYPEPSFGTISAVDVAKTNSQRIYVGTDDGRLWTTSDGGTNWTKIQSSNLPARWVTRIAVDPNNENIAYATFSGFRSNDNQAHVYKTVDGGITWADISANLPDAPVNDMVIHPIQTNQLFVGTDVGVFVTKDGGQTWYKLGLGLPITPVMDIKYHLATNKLFAGTFGRGIYEITLTELN